ncbi:MAG: hypothetical protein HQL53_03170 [Magnetococcales bacterium]|nr:hypothetical protein [Magnetococcales bacterium]
MRVLAITLAVIMGLMFVPASAQAERPNCKDLDEVAEGLDSVATHLSEYSSIEPDSPLEELVGEIIDAMISIAEVEDNSDLSAAVRTMKRIWRSDTSWEDDLPDFVQALDDSAASIDGILKEECR